MELDDPAAFAGEVGGELLVVDGLGGRDVEDLPAGVVQALLEVGFVGVDEEGRIQVADLLGSGAADEHRRGLDPADLGGRGVAALRNQPSVQEEGAGQRRADARESPSAGLRLAVGVEQLSTRDAGARVGIEGSDEGLGCPRPKLRVLVQEQRVLADRLAQQRRVVFGLPRSLLELEQPQRG